MSKKKEPKLIKQYFIKRPPGTGYHANHVHEVPADVANDFQKSGYCRAATQTLPEDFPGREAFIEAGIETVDEIKALDDPTEIKGIGDSTAKDLVDYLTGGSKE